MSFAQPLAWYLLLLAIPIILFYILKIRLRQEPVSTTIFWEQVFEERRTRSFWRRLRHLVSLLLSLLFLGMLVGAVLDPAPSWQAKPTRCVIIVDNSAGMNARLGSGRSTRLEQAKSELHRLLAMMEVGRQTALLTAGGPPRIVVGFTDHPGTLRRGVDSIPKTDYPTSLREAVELARQLLASEENSTVLVYTDGCSPDLAELEALPNVHFFPVGAPIDNLAITRFQPRRSQGDAVGYEILIEAVNFGTESVQARLEVELEDRVVDVIPLTLEPNRPQTKIVRDTTAQGGRLRAELKAIDETEDLFPTDNTAIAFLPARPTQHIYLYGEDDFFLLKVLQSQPNVELHLLAEPPSQVPEDGVLVLYRIVPDIIPSGNVLIVDPRNGCNLFEIGETLEMPIVAKEENDSPLMKFVHLMNLTIRGARSLMLKALAPDSEDGLIVEWTVLAETPEALPIYAALTAPDSEVLVLTADLKQGDLALRTAFPIMVSQALIRFRGSGGELEQAQSTGQPVQIPLRTTSRQVSVQSPSGQKSLFPVKSGIVSLGMLPECGVWTISGPDVPETELARLACNLSDSTESNLRLAPDSFYEQTPDAAALRSGTRPVWFWLALLALAFTSLEWFLYQRRWID